MKVHVDRRREKRRALKDGLRSLLGCRRPNLSPEVRCSTSGILRRVISTTPILPQVSSLSLFPDFESSRFNLDRCSVSSRSTLPLVPFFQSRDALSNISLLPVTSLSQVDLIPALVESNVAGPFRPRWRETPSWMGGVSQQASILSLRPAQSIRNRRSTLRLRRSTLSLKGVDQNGSAEVGGLPTALFIGEFQPSPTNSKTQSRIDSRPVSDQSSNSDVSVTSLKHFGSFCVLDTCAPGCPITATSEDLRYIFEVGDRFCLNSEECIGSSIDIVVGNDAEGNDVTHLVLFSPLLSPQTGKARFVLAALVEVSDFVKAAAQGSLCDESLEHQASEDDGSGWQTRPAHRDSMVRSYDLLPETLLQGCCIEEEPTKPSKYRTERLDGSIQWDHSGGSPDDVWLELAREEGVGCASRKNHPRRINGDGLSLAGGSNSSTSTQKISFRSSTVDDVLAEFMAGLKELYSDFFLLARSPLDDKYYEICNVSPSVYASGEYVEGHLTHTPSAVVENMSASLGKETPFQTRVRWGCEGLTKDLFCIPVYGQSNITWICMLVNPEMPVVW
jgi:hypothetical protein